MVGLQGGGCGIGEGAADDLLDMAGVEVDARAEAGHFGRCGCEQWSVWWWEERST